MSSQYNLQLKATLDTSQVQQELQKLKSAQMQAQHEAGAAGGGTAASSIASLDLKKLNAIMTKLDQTIASLRNTIKSQSGPSAAPGTGGTSMLLPGSVPKQIKANWKEWLDSKQYKQFDKFVRKTISKEFEGIEQQFLMMRTGVTSVDDPQFAHKILSSQYGKALFGKSFNYEKEVAQFQARQNAEYKEALKMQKAQARFARSFGTLFGGMILNDIGGMVGGEAGKWMQAGGSGLQAGGGAAMTAAMMGIGGAAAPIGIIVGAVAAISNLQSASEQAAAAVYKMAQQIEAAYDAAHQTALRQQSAVKEARHQANADLMERTGMKDKAAESAKYWNENAEALKKQLAEADPLAEERKIREEAEARKQQFRKDMFDANNGPMGDVVRSDNAVVNWVQRIAGLTYAEKIKEGENKIDAEALDQIAASQKNFESLQNDISSAEKIASMYQGVVDKIGAQQKKDMELSKAEVAKRLQLAEANDSSIFGYKQQTAANQTQAFADKVLGDKTLGPLEKFNKIAEQLDIARSSKNSALNEAFGIAKYLKDNEGKLDSAEVQAQMKKQAGFERDAAAQASLVGILESALANIQSSAVAPDLSHVTSLAQYGFNMGEKDDTVERMDRYYSRSLNLQEQIKNKLQEGVKTEATYSE